MAIAVNVSARSEEEDRSCYAFCCAKDRPTRYAIHGIVCLFAGAVNLSLALANPTLYVPALRILWFIVAAMAFFGSFFYFLQFWIVLRKRVSRRTFLVLVLH